MRLREEELQAALEQHELWVNTCISPCDAGDDVSGSGLRLLQQEARRLAWARVDLRGVDLQRADLRGAALDQGISKCVSFAEAKVTADVLTWLILHPKWAEVKETVQIDTVEISSE